MYSPLKGLKVVDMSKVLAGPLCAQILSDLGADVVKVEPPAGDDTRGWPPLIGGNGAVFMSANRNKQSICIDLKQAEGREVLYTLLQDADVVVENFRTGAMAKLGLDYASLAQRFPRLIYASITGFGQDGPLAKTAGYDLIVQAFTSMMHMTGQAGGEPVRAGFSPLDQGTGLWAVIGILAALNDRQTSGQGRHVDVSLFDTGMSFLGYTSQIYWENKKIPERRGTQHESLCPYQAFEASDGTILIGIGNDSLFRKYAELIGQPALASDPKFATNKARVEHFGETVGLVSAVTATKTVKEWAALLNGAGIPNSPLNTIQDTLAEEQTAARHIVLDYQHPVAGPLKTVALPIKYNDSTQQVRSHPPLLGEHTDAVLARHGFTDPQITALRRSGAVS